MAQETTQPTPNRNNRNTVTAITKKQIIRLHSKGLSQFGIATKLKIKPWEARRVIAESIKEDYNSLLKS